MDKVILIDAFFKVLIGEIFSSEIMNENFKTYILIKLDDLKFKISKVRVAGKVLRVNYRGKFWDCVIFDDTGNILLREWEKSGKLLSKLRVNDVIDVYALLRKFKETIYLVPKIIVQIDERALNERPNEILRVREKLAKIIKYQNG